MGEAVEREAPPGRRSSRGLMAEGLVIVASILLAFLIDAWWDDRRDRIDESEILVDLRSELSTNIEGARRIASVHMQYGERLEILETMTDAGAAAMPPDSATAYLVAGYAWQTFDPTTGVVDGVTTSGRIEVVSDPELRRRLADWLRRLTDLREEAELMTRAAERFYGGLAEYGPISDGGSGSPNERLSILLGSRELMGIARTKAWYGTMYGEELGRTADFAEGILTVIGAR